MIITRCLVGWQKKDDELIKIIQSNGRIWKKEKLTVEEFAEGISNGRPYRAGIYNDVNKDPIYQYYTNNNAHGSSVFALDFDDVALHPQILLDRFKEKGFLTPNIWYYSYREGQTEGHRYRFVYCFRDVVEREVYEEKYKDIIAYIEKEFGVLLDVACKNLGRVWWGTCHGAEVLVEEEYESEKLFELIPQRPFCYKPSVSHTKTPTFGTSFEDEIYEESEYSGYVKKYRNNQKKKLFGDLMEANDDFNELMSGEQNRHIGYAERLPILFSMCCLKGPSAKTTFNTIKKAVDWSKHDNWTPDKLSTFLTTQKPQYLARIWRSVFDGRKLDLEEWMSEWENPHKPKKTHRENFDDLIRLTAEHNKKMIYMSNDELDEKVRKIIRNTIAKNKTGRTIVDLPTGSGKSYQCLDFLCENYHNHKYIYASDTFVNLEEKYNELVNVWGVPEEDIIYIPRKGIAINDQEKNKQKLGMPYIYEGMIERKQRIKDAKEAKAGKIILMSHSLLERMPQMTYDYLLIDEHPHWYSEYPLGSKTTSVPAEEITQDYLWWLAQSPSVSSYRNIKMWKEYCESKGDRDLFYDKKTNTIYKRNPLFLMDNYIIFSAGFQKTFFDFYFSDIDYSYQKVLYDIRTKGRLIWKPLGYSQKGVKGVMKDPSLLDEYRNKGYCIPRLLAKHTGEEEVYEGFEVIKEINIYASTGVNVAKGKKMLIPYEPRWNSEKYELWGRLLGINDFHTTTTKIKGKNVYTYSNPVLQKIHLEEMEYLLLQLVGRVRANRFEEAVVLYLGSFPIDGFEVKP